MGTATAARSELDIQGARFYPIESVAVGGKPLWVPSVTTILKMWPSDWKPNWTAKVEKEGILDDMQTFLQQNETASRGDMLAQVMMLREGSLRHFGVMKKAANIGSSVHAWLEWKVKGMLGVDIGPEPILLPGAELCRDGAMKWMEGVNLRPISVEQRVWDVERGYAGRYDVEAEVDWEVEGKETERRVVLVDWKSSAGIYDEMIMQNLAYRAAAARMGKKVKGGIVVKLAKTADDPFPFEYLQVPYNAVMLEAFLKCCELWRLRRRVEGKWMGGHADEAEIAELQKRKRRVVS